VSAALEGGDFYGGNRREEPSLRDSDPCRVPGSSRYAPALLELVHGKRSRESVIEAREWSFARATVERSTARRVAEGMAPHQGADHAKDDGIGSIR
jgi:hypothetical protein